MNILVTGAKGMVGTALCNNLKNIRDGKNKTRPALDIKEIYEYDLDSTPAELDEYCRKADFVFNLAGVNRPENPEDFMKGNFGFASDLLNCLKKHNNKATIMLSSSIQATLAGRFGNSEYGRSKKAGEELFFQYAEETGAKVAVYRFVNLMGHSRPKYNSAVSTFCPHWKCKYGRKTQRRRQNHTQHDPKIRFLHKNHPLPLNLFLTQCIVQHRSRQIYIQQFFAHCRIRLICQRLHIVRISFDPA